MAAQTRFEARDGRARLLIAGRALSRGNRVILFDAQGLAIGVGPALK